MRFILALILTSFFALDVVPGWAAGAPPVIAGSVNEVQINESLVELELSAEPILRQHGAVSTERLERFKIEALERLIVRELLFPEAKRRGLLPAPELVARNVARVEKALGGEARLLQVLLDGGLTKADYNDWIQKDLASAALRESLYVAATTAEALQYYARNMTTYVQTARVKAQMILTPMSPLPTTLEVAGAQDVAFAVAAAWQATPATDPTRLAERFQSRFIDMGLLHQGAVIDELADIFSYAPGQLSAPRRVVYGWHVVKVLEHYPQRQLPFEDVREAIGSSLTQKRGEETYSRLVEALRSKAVIVRRKR